MKTETGTDGAAGQTLWSRAARLYASALFVVAALTLGLQLRGLSATAASEVLSPASAFFLAYGLLTITIGYRQPNLGYYSFDRVAQVASILVLGPLAAAVVNGVASFLYPWHRLWKGVPLQDVVFAALNNSGLMALMIWLAGSAYVALGGAVPLTGLAAGSIVELIVLVVLMQALNDAGMLGLLALRRRNLSPFFNRFTYALELGSGATAVLVALIYNTMGVDVLLLTLAVLTLGMCALRQFAEMRHQLEMLVAERTQKLEEKTRELEYQATRDNLTGVFNRRYADGYLARELESCRRSGRRFTVALADVDLFKQINDFHSHATGDSVLRQVATILGARCRASDVLARYGGEEFLVCFPDTASQEAWQLCEDLRRGVERADWSRFGLVAGVTISFGLAEFRADASPDRLLARADQRLYEAKNGGRNLVVA